MKGIEHGVSVFLGISNANSVTRRQADSVIEVSSQHLEGLTGMTDSEKD
jgi:hypothetical protein